MRAASILLCGILLAGACTRAAPPPSSLTVAPSPARAQPSRPTFRWRVVPSPNRKGRTDWNFLNSVAAVSPDLGWAVGAAQTPGDCCVGHALIEQWDGRRWKVVPNPGARSRAPEGPLNGVVGVSATNAWAVGQLGSRPLIEHWDGRRWRLVPNPKVTSPAWLGAVTAISANDIWAVGYARPGPLIEHWDGTSWIVVPTPHLVLPPKTVAGLHAVAASSASDIWAVGEAAATGSVAGNGRVLIEHWDGHRWQIVVRPQTGTRGYLTGVTILSATDAWAVGYTPHFPLFDHWDGQHWHLVSRWPASTRAGPGPSGAGSLYGVAARSANDIWAVGVSNSKTLVDHWDGRRWSLVPSPNPDPGWNGLSAVGLGALGEWAVGSASNTDGRVWETLIEKCGDVKGCGA